MICGLSYNSNQILQLDYQEYKSQDPHFSVSAIQVVLYVCISNENGNCGMKYFPLWIMELWKMYAGRL